ncbi:MAG TPA: hypothetical protein VMW39_05800 [bacterium]|nr:hypothetical protein [bacterium]
MLYLIFTIDGDWKEYFDVDLLEDKRLPNVGVMQGLIEQEIEVARRNLKGRFIHFVHTSPRARKFFLDKPFMKFWRQIIENGGDIGIHPHEDDPHKAYYFQDSSRMKKVISGQVGALRKQGLNVCAYRGGYLAFSSNLIPILEKNGLCFDFSCEPGRYMKDSRSLVSDWRGAPTSLYQMSYQDYRKVGDSGVYEIPVGTSKGHYLYFEKSTPEIVEETAFDLREKSMKDSHDIIVSVLTHTYEYTSSDEIKNIEEKISLLKKYGRFINLKELRNVINDSQQK